MTLTLRRAINISVAYPKIIQQKHLLLYAIGLLYTKKHFHMMPFRMTSLHRARVQQPGHVDKRRILAATSTRHRSRHSQPYLMPIAFALLAWVRLQVAVFGADKEVSDDEILRATYIKYQEESTKPVPPKEKQKFLVFWEGEFKKALEATKAGGVLRLRMLDELGTQELALTKTEDAAATYRTMASYAAQIKDAHGGLIAAENLFNFLKAGKLDAFTNAARNYENLAQTLVSQSDTPEARSKFCDALNQIASAFLSRAKLDSATSKTLVSWSAEAFTKSIALDETGSTPLVVKYWYLAQCQTKLGLNREAASTYQKLQSMKQTLYSPLWIEYLRISALTEKDSDQYRELIEAALTSLPRDGKQDDYESTLRHELGLSFRNAGRFDKSTQVLSANIGRSQNDDVNAYDMYLVAQNFRASGDLATVKSMLQDLLKSYPKTGSAALALTEIRELSKGSQVGQLWSTRILLLFLLLSPLACLFFRWPFNHPRPLQGSNQNKL